VNVTFDAMLEIDFQLALESFKTQFSGDLFGYHHRHIVLKDGKIVGGLMELVEVAIQEFRIDDAEVANTMQFQREAKERSLALMQESGQPAVYFELFQKNAGEGEDQSFGRIVIQLFDNICPLACENFIQLCKESYRNCPIHRVVPNGWLQTGDVVDGTGANSRSASGNPIPDESFSVEFDSKLGGIVGYSSSGPHSNGSQFFITLGPCEWMNCTKVGFGRVIQGYDVLKLVNEAPARNQRPNPKIYIGDCGVVK
jgi:cyclophilin family peptidyl-prolyl cis-trans isomerase